MKKLLRSKSQKMIAGVLGGIAEYFSVDVTVVRLLFVLLAALTAVVPAILIYVVAMIIMPMDEF
ncbi:hypothetical protein BHF71_06225 [Vulcanibacillus modesticaldus]|uniref:Phage shock protein PspC N-terminal domain-containing protein n=1 Tax=Vulcanibacillus modesticaldus TaxID=337097 RepID=A0A1D2YWM9_9BACI|nr:PspC domain-containing protein [Vulcanibacillus modesticaldus]OEG00119.1 hypothetical protein BHF71_06225 [Vulcanibacillus modesticaldus]